MTSRFSDLLNTFIAFNLQNIYVFIKINLLKFTVSSVSQLFFILKENLSPHDLLLVYIDDLYFYSGKEQSPTEFTSSGQRLRYCRTSASSSWCSC